MLWKLVSVFLFHCQENLAAKIVRTKKSPKNVDPHQFDDTVSSLTRLLENGSSQNLFSKGQKATENKFFRIPNFKESLMNAFRFLHCDAQQLMTGRVLPK